MRRLHLMCRLGLHQWVYRRAEGAESEKRCTVGGCPRSDWRVVTPTIDANSQEMVPG
jgi:hypothetical protein